MKVVLDTNVLIAAFVFKGFAAKIFDYCTTQATIILSPFLNPRTFFDQIEADTK